jgi:hypothetical protein
MVGEELHQVIRVSKNQTVEIVAFFILLHLKRNLSHCGDHLVHFAVVELGTLNHFSTILFVTNHCFVH